LLAVSNPRLHIHQAIEKGVSVRERTDTPF